MLSLRSDSSIGTIIHEIGHMLGLAHEQDRQDCEISAERRKNILFSTGTGSPYEKSLKECDNNGAFDAASMMLYASGYQQKLAPIQGDVDAVKAMYGW